MIKTMKKMLQFIGATLVFCLLVGSVLVTIAMGDPANGHICKGHGFHRCGVSVNLDKVEIE